MNRALFSGLSSTAAQQVKLDVAANNLGNVSTVGYKAQRVTFQDAYYQTLRSGQPSSTIVGGTSPIQVGSGVRVATTSIDETQGAVERTGQSLDAAVDGRGMFVVSGPNGKCYTREGVMQLDDTGTLVMASTGFRVQGWQAINGQVDALAETGDLAFALQTARSPVATTAATVQGNLPSGLAVGEPYACSISVYDALGQTHRVDLTFAKSADLTWDVVTTVEGTTVNSTVTFTSEGIVDTGGSVSLAAPMTGGADDLNMTIDLSSLTQFVNGSELVATYQDGYGAATLLNLSIVDGGVVMGHYSDGRTGTLGKVALGTFANEGGLQRVGDNLYAMTAASGIVQIGEAGVDGRGNIVGQALEGSNTDLTSSFLDMLVTQRAYQANTRVISTANQFLEEAIRLADR